jgi:hypothetical protein
MSAVDVGREIKQMHFKQRSYDLMGGRAVAEVGGAPVRAARQAP